MTAEERKKIAIRVAKFCAFRERSPKEVREKIRKLGASDQEEDLIFTELQEGGFFDESRFAQAYVNDKFRFNKWGKVKIRYHLLQFDIKPKLIEEAISGIPDELYENAVSELLKKKKDSLCAENDNLAKKKKVFNYLISKGFEYHDVQKQYELLDI